MKRIRIKDIWPRIQSFPIKEEVRQVFISFLAMLERVSVVFETEVRVGKKVTQMVTVKIMILKISPSSLINYCIN